MANQERLVNIFAFIREERLANPIEHIILSIPFLMIYTIFCTWIR